MHRALGPGLLESAYEVCFCRELARRDIDFERQVEVPLYYLGEPVEFGYRLDVVIGRRIIVELKAVERLLPLHTAQLLTYMKLSGIHVGLLVNFNVPILRDGLRRFTLTRPGLGLPP